MHAGCMLILFGPSLHAQQNHRVWRTGPRLDGLYVFPELPRLEDKPYSLGRFLLLLVLGRELGA